MSELGIHSQPLTKRECSIPIVITIFLLVASGILLLPSAAQGYPPPPSGSRIVLSAVASFSGSPSKGVTINVTSTESASPVTSLQFLFNDEQTFVNVQLYQMSGVSTSISPPPSVSGTPVLVVFFSVTPEIESDISSVVINFQVPLVALATAGLSLTGSNLVVERYSDNTGTWTALPTVVTGSDNSFVYLKAVSLGLSLLVISASSTTPTSTSSTSSTTTSLTTLSSTTNVSSTSGVISVEQAIIVVAVVVLVLAIGLLAMTWRTYAARRQNQK